MLGSMLGGGGKTYETGRRKVFGVLFIYTKKGYVGVYDEQLTRSSMLQRKMRPKLSSMMATYYFDSCCGVSVLLGMGF